MLIGWFGNQWFMDFNSFCQIELYLDKRILDWRFYILVWALGIGHGAKGKGQRAKGKGQRGKERSLLLPFSKALPSRHHLISPSPHTQIKEP
jgi:hypothetical protein